MTPKQQPVAERLRWLVKERRHVQLGVVEDDLLNAASRLELAQNLLDRAKERGELSDAEVASFAQSESSEKNAAPQDSDSARAEPVNAELEPAVAAHGGRPMTLRECAEAEESTPDKVVYLCRASGEGSHNFRVCQDEAAVFAFYEEMTGRDEDGSLDSITKDFRDPDAWSNDGTTLELDLYCAKFEVWKADLGELLLPSASSDGIGLSAHEASVIAAAVALVPLLEEGWDDQDTPEDRNEGAKACDALVAAVNAMLAAPQYVVEKS